MFRDICKIWISESNTPHLKKIGKNKIVEKQDEVIPLALTFDLEFTTILKSANLHFINAKISIITKAICIMQICYHLMKY